MSQFPDTPAGRAQARKIARQGRDWAAFKQRYDRPQARPSFWAIWPRAVLLTIKEFLSLPLLPFLRDYQEPDLVAFGGGVIAWRWNGREYSSRVPGSLELLERRVGRPLRAPWA